MKYAVRFHFHGGGRPAASAGGAARPAAGGRRPGQRGVPTRAAEQRLAYKIGKYGQILLSYIWVLEFKK